MIVGIDPGLSGGIAVLDGAAPEPPQAVVYPMPIFKTTTKKGYRNVYDESLLAAFGRSWALFLMAQGLHVFVEKQQALPSTMGGASANFQRGLAQGLWIGMLASYRIPYTLVPPQSWQKVMLLGIPGEDTKQRSVVAAGRLFPNVSLLPTPRCTKPHDGYADALLIAEYGRRSLA